MDYTISLEDKAIVLVEVTGTFDTSDAEVFGPEAFRLAKDKNLSRVLIDVTDTKLIASTINLFEFASHLDDFELDRSSLKVAVVYSSEAEDHRFFETVAKNRGWWNLSYFHSRGEAITWLTAS